MGTIARNRKRATMFNVTFRRFERSGALEGRIREIGERLQRCDPRSTQCHISVLGGSPREPSVSLRVDVSVPGAEIHPECSNDGGPGRGDAFLALQKSIECARI